MYIVNRIAEDYLLIYLFIYLLGIFETGSLVPAGLELTA